MPRDGTKVAVDAGGQAVATPVLAVGLGRGANGKSSGLAEMKWRAEAAGRRVLVLDGDYHRSKTLTELFPDDATHPDTAEPADVKAWLSRGLNTIASERVSAILDLGTETRLLEEYCRDLRLVEFCRRRGIAPLAAYFLGPEPEDLRHVLAVWRGGYFRPERTLLVVNEGVVRGGKTVAGAFDATMADAGFQEMVASGVKPILMNRLACMDEARRPGVGFYRAAETLDPVQGFMSEDWTEALEAKRVKVGAVDWLP